MCIVLGYGHDQRGRLAPRLQLGWEARGQQAGFNLDRLKPGGDGECPLN